MPSIALPLLAQVDNGGPGYVVAAVLVSAALLLVYLLIVAIRVRDAARRLEVLEQRLDAAKTPAVDDVAGSNGTHSGPVEVRG